jgi:hypothetical protein
MSDQEELEVLRDLRRRVDEMAEAATMLFKVHGGAPVYPAVRAEVPIEAWDTSWTPSVMSSATSWIGARREAS